MLSDLLLLILFLFASGFFSGIEIAYISSDRLRVELERKKGSKRGKILANFIENPSDFLGTTLVGNNIVLVILGKLADEFLGTYFDLHSNIFTGMLAITLITTMVVLIFGEFLPKVSFQINPTGILFLFAYPLHFIKVTLFPIVWVMVKSSNAIIRRLFKINPEQGRPVFTRGDLGHFIDSIHTEEEEDLDKIMFQNALFINTIKVRDCMIPRNEIVAIELNESIETLRNLFIEKTLSRILVYQDTIDEIVGYVHHQSLLHQPESIKSILWELPVRHEFTPARDVMNALIKENINMAWIVDERGGTAGIVTLEDLLEEIFGEIADEHDEVEDNPVIGKNEFVFPGRIEIDAINQEYNLELPENDELYQTLSGYLVTELEKIPSQGELFTLGKYEFEIKEGSETRIEKIKITRILKPN